MALDHEAIRARVAAYYTERVRTHGETARGVDWNSAGSQRLRFGELLRILPPPDGREVTILEYGCGYGALVDVLDERGQPFRYVGYDISEEMVRRARRLHDRPDCGFTAHAAELEPADYVVASGVLNVKLATPEPEWREHVARVLDELDDLSVKGFAFNALTSYSDADKMRDDLFYADPCATFDHCKRTFSPRVALLHDYPLYEFTVLVRKDDP